MKQPPGPGEVVLGGVDWSRWSVILLKPDCVRRDLTEAVLDRIRREVAVLAQRQVVVEDWQIFVHYWDMLVNKDWFTDRDLVACLRNNYVGERSRRRARPWP